MVVTTAALETPQIVYWPNCAKPCEQWGPGPGRTDPDDCLKQCLKCCNANCGGNDHANCGNCCSSYNFGDPSVKHCTTITSS